MSSASTHRTFVCTLGAVSALWLSSCASTQDSAGNVLNRAAKAMGADSVASLRYVAEGTGHSFGQAFKAQGAWPRVTLHSVTRTVDFANGAMRDEVVLSRAEPLGGGGYPLSGQQRNDQYIVGDTAWNVVGTSAVPGARFVADRLHQLAITPHGVIKAAAHHAATLQPGAQGDTAVSFSSPGKYTAVAHIGADGLVKQGPLAAAIARPVMEARCAHRG